MPIRSSPTTTRCTEHTIAIAVSIRTYRATLCIRGWAVARVRWLAGVHRRRESSPMMLRWPKLGGIACIVLRVESRFDSAKPRVRRSLWASPASPTPRRRWGQTSQSSFDLVDARVASDLAAAPPVSLIG
jgi:hypothetical protein